MMIYRFVKRMIYVRVLSNIIWVKIINEKKMREKRIWLDFIDWKMVIQIVRPQTRWILLSLSQI